jgi:hypothetical protein
VKDHLGKFKTLEDANSKEHGEFGVLVIETKGKTIMEPIEIPIGDARRPVPPAQVVEKYVRNAAEVVGNEVAQQTSRMLMEIEKLSSIRPVLDLLAKRA